MSIPLQKNPKNTKTLRQELRASATPAEKLLWQYNLTRINPSVVRNGDGYAFRFDRPLAIPRNLNEL